jgi:hypothetical protein
MDEELEDWENCDGCEINKAQIEWSRVMSDESFVHRRSVFYGRETVEYVYSRYHHTDTYEMERLCFSCYIAKYGTEPLKSMKIWAWRDQPAGAEEPDEELARAERQDDLDRRELDCALGDVDIFRELELELKRS